MTHVISPAKDAELATLAERFTSGSQEEQAAILADLARRDRADRIRGGWAALRAQWFDGAHAQYLAAEAECCGNLVNAAGRAAGVTDWSLWEGSADRAYRYATEELRSFWERNPRITVGTYRRQSAALKRAQHHDYATARNDDETETEGDMGAFEQAALRAGGRMAAGTARAGARTATRAMRSASHQQRVSAARADVVQRAAQERQALTATTAVAVRPPVQVERVPIDGDRLLRDARKFLRHFAVWPSESALTAATLWAAHTHARDPKTQDPVWEYASRLMITASEYGAGKSWFAKIVAQLCPAGKILLEPTKPSLIDEIAERKTIVVTELDELLSTPGRNRGIVSVINGSYEPDHYHTRKQGGKVQEIHLFAPMILDGLDTLLSPTRPDMRAIVTRCCPIIRVKMAPDGYRRPRWNTEARAIAAQGRDRLGAWMAQQVAWGIADARPDLPEDLGSPRRCALWEPLFAVALRADKGEPGYWSAALAEAAVDLESQITMPEEDEGTDLDKIMAGWEDDE